MIGFLILAAIMVAGALGVLLLKEPVHVALSLVATFLALAVTYLTLDAHFLAAIQVIVYTGAIMVLFLFVIMLLNVRDGVPARRFRLLPLGVFLTSLLMLGVVGVTLLLEPQQLPAAETVADALQGGSPAMIGEILFTDYVLAFQLVGVLLLTGIIGAVSLVQRSGRNVDGGQA